MRNLCNPQAVKQTDHWMKVTVATINTSTPNNTNDYGGVHWYSGIPNNAWYLMTVGGTNPTSGETVKNPLGYEKSEWLWYQVLTKKKVAGSASFADFARA